MTGYASVTFAGAQSHNSAATAAPATGSFSVDVRSVNSRFLDAVLRLPDELRHLEPALRERLTRQLKRGKVELRVDTRSADPSSSPLPQAPASEVLGRLSHLESAVRGWLPQAQPLSVMDVLQLTRQPNRTPLRDDDVLACADQALAALREARAREGERLADSLRERTAGLRALVTQARPLVPQIVQRQQARFIERWHQALAQASQTEGSAATVDASQASDRALAEAAALALRIDVAEELDRLSVHLDEIDRQLAQGGDLGKRLDFLIQELHREANTLGSKSSALDSTAIAIDMKVLIEQMREQVQNIE
ncbi:YicC/YloC family endoribonuclease [Amphibiibacter pelophylacis]|uniref:YicC/YloC family endoribonuclease n=1 Tax=Amphibiibacter pelophylacis TaxID=1799477 RepID=A0ACC6NY68_9BURK